MLPSVPNLKQKSVHSKNIEKKIVWKAKKGILKKEKFSTFAKLNCLKSGAVKSQLYLNLEIISFIEDLLNKIVLTSFVR